MINQMLQYSFSREDTVTLARTTPCSSKLIVSKLDCRSIDPALLFQRFLNISQLIDLIKETLFECGCSVRRLEDGVGVGIFFSAVQKSKSWTCTVIGVDTDPLILLLCHAESNNQILYYRSDIKSRNEAIHNNIYRRAN